MINISDSKEVLKAEKCGDLFTNDPDEAKIEFRKLAKMYHPDSNPSSDAIIVFQHINELYNKAVKLFAAGIWEASNYFEITSTTGKVTKLKYLRTNKFELGMQYIAKTVVIYVFDCVNKKYYDNALSSIDRIHYKDEQMKKEFSRYMPKVIDHFESTEGKWVIVISKTPEVCSLKDLLRHFDGGIESKHVAWMISRLCNLCCFLDYNNLSHNGISLENCYFSSEYHTILLLGGWWYCVPQGEKMLGTQAQIYNIMTPKTKTDKLGSIVTDLESVKLLSTLLLGKTQIPEAVKDWLNTGSSESAVKTFVKWNKALDESYGPRKFIDMNVSEKDIYK